MMCILLHHSVPPTTEHSPSTSNFRENPDLTGTVTGIFTFWGENVLTMKWLNALIYRILRKSREGNLLIFWVAHYLSERVI